jgi:formamidopyrimidine-DNA glycosylase
MPELPEVEVVVQQIRPVLIGKTILDRRAIFPKLRYPIELPPVGAKITDVFRRNKYIIIAYQYQFIDNQSHDMGHFFAIWHLGMSGQIRYFEDVRALEKHEHAELLLTQGTIRYYDPRRFGALLLSTDWQQHPLLKDLGCEPLDVPASKLARHWFKIAQAQKNQKPIKPFLMNGKHVVGIGNIYASEILFQAKIHPQSIVQKLSLKDWQKIATHTQSILKQAIDKGGSTLHDFVDINGEIGEFQQTHFVYAKQNQTCLHCSLPNISKTHLQLAKIQKLTQENRSTFFCPRCQKLKI